MATLAAHQSRSKLVKCWTTLARVAVAEAVSQSRPEFDHVPIRDFVPLFVERGAKARLRELA
ncbi:three-helix bundle dimerization domain-containing protein [Kribbella sp. CCNWLY201]|uniref:three-helix bundle dimerization domain-containing protein n=1 Tax=unclassified Kribbella TaxID=2644121 RepID=UPI003FA55CC5